MSTRFGSRSISFTLSAACLALSGCSWFAGSLPSSPAADAGASIGDDASTMITNNSDAGATSGDATTSTNNDGSTSSTNTNDGGPTTCTATFSFTPPSGTSPQSVAVMGEWKNFAAPGNAMTSSGGVFTATVPLAPGLYAYKLLVDGTWEFDPGQGLRKFVGGVENSAIQVADCSKPSLTSTTTNVTRASAGQGHFTAKVAFHPAISGSAIDSKSIKATLVSEGVTTTATATLDADKSSIDVDAATLADGKYTVFVTANDLAGTAPLEPIRLVFWVEANTFTWNDTLLYMVMTDRFKDADTASNGAAIANVDPREQFQGGDFEGVMAAINDGTFDRLGVRALWLSPFHTNPQDAWPAADGVHETTGYHGYWPVKAREVDPRFGGADELKAMVKAAHAHGIRVMQDFPLKQVHQEHEYFVNHPEWFTNGCVCGTDNCDWTVHAFDCEFEPYLPNVDWTNPTVVAQYQADAIWWIDQFNLDGFRFDAVKQVIPACIMNMTTAIRGEFEPGGLTKFFMTGETAMGWSNCGTDAASSLACNQINYGTISEYIGKFGLDGQEDFTLYYAVPMNVFADDAEGMIHADFWTQASQTQYPAGAVMMPYVGTQDTPRLVSITDGNLSGDESTVDNQWDNVIGAPMNANSYQRQRLAYSWQLALPGMPMIYYGDEFAQWGGVDPNNRVMWRGESGTLTADEQATLSWVQLLGTTRQSLVALRRGAYVPVYNTSETDLMFARQAPTGEVALVALTKSGSPESFTATLPTSLEIQNGTVLHDRLSTNSVQVTNGQVTVNLPAWGAAILAP